MNEFIERIDNLIRYCEDVMSREVKSLNGQDANEIATTVRNHLIMANEKAKTLRRRLWGV